MRICRLAHRAWFPRVRVSPTLTVGRDSLNLPAMLREPTHVFTMPAPGPDLFAQSDAFIESVFGVMNAQDRHEFQVCTRHIERVARIAGKVSWGPNIWLGTLIEDLEVGDEMAMLRATPAKVRFAHVKTDRSLPTFDVRGLQFVIVENAVEPQGFHRLEADCTQAGTRLFLGPRVADAELRTPAPNATVLPVGSIHRRGR